MASSTADQHHQQHHLDLLVQFEGQPEDVVNTVKSLRQLSAVEDVSIVGGDKERSSRRVLFIYLFNYLVHLKGQLTPISNVLSIYVPQN